MDEMDQGWEIMVVKSTYINVSLDKKILRKLRK